MNKIVGLLTIIFIIIQQPIFGQNDKYVATIEIGKLSGFGNVDYGNQVTFKNQNNAFRLRASFGRFVHKKTSIGLGVGLDGYNNPTYNTFPVYLEVRRFVMEKGSSLFAFLNLGAALKIGPEFQEGLVFGSGIGYKMQKRRINILPSIGFHLQQINDAKAIIIDPNSWQVERFESKINLKNISFNLAIQF